MTNNDNNSGNLDVQSSKKDLYGANSNVNLPRSIYLRDKKETSSEANIQYKFGDVQFRGEQDSLNHDQSLKEYNRSSGEIQRDEDQKYTTVENQSQKEY
jgi:hypothetical protein